MEALYRVFGLVASIKIVTGRQENPE